MKTLKTARWLVLSLAPLVSSALAAQAETSVSVELVSGRTFTGVVDSRTNGQQLWLRWHVGQVQLQRPIAWERIASARIGDESIEIADLEDRASELATPGRKTTLENLPVMPAEAPSALPAQVRSIQCDAWLANWDADAEFDGLALSVEPLDEEGNVLPIDGEVAAELTTIDYVPGYQASTSGGRIPATLGKWKQPWQKQRRLVKLEFQARPPQENPQLDRYALLKVRVTIPGHGVFEQQLDGIRTRPFSPVANNLWR